MPQTRNLIVFQRMNNYLHMEDGTFILSITNSARAFQISVLSKSLFPLAK